MLDFRQKTPGIGNFSLTESTRSRLARKMIPCPWRVWQEVQAVLQL